jgi:hypothetical protein
MQSVGHQRIMVTASSAIPLIWDKKIEPVDIRQTLQYTQQFILHLCPLFFLVAGNVL